MKKFIFIMLCCVASLLANAQEAKDNSTEIVRDLQLWKRSTDHFQMAMYVPIEYWTYALRKDKNISEEVIASIRKMLKDYVVLIALDMKMGTSGAADVKDRSALRKSLMLTDSLTNNYFPIDDADQSEDLTAISEALKKVFSNLAGDMGSGMEVFYFKVKDKNGKNIISAKKEWLFHHSDRND